MHHKHHNAKEVTPDSLNTASADVIYSKKEKVWILPNDTQQPADTREVDCVILWP